MDAPFGRIVYKIEKRISDQSANTAIIRLLCHMHTVQQRTTAIRPSRTTQSTSMAHTHTHLP